MESTYCNLFQALKSIKPGLNSETIMTNIENAVTNVILKYFLIMKIRSCFF